MREFTFINAIAVSLFWCSSFNLPAIIFFIFTSTCFSYYIKHPHNDNKICPLLSFMTDSKYLGTIQIWWNLNEHYFYLTSTKSVIFQIDANCSPFQSLNMLPFHIRLVSNVSRYFFKTGTFCLLFLSSHVSPGFQFDNNHFDIPLWKLVKPRDPIETKPPIENYSENINQ